MRVETDAVVQSSGLKRAIDDVLKAEKADEPARVNAFDHFRDRLTPFLLPPSPPHIMPCARGVPL